VSGQILTLVSLPLGKEPLVPTGQEAGWKPAPVLTLFFPLPEIEPPALQPIVRRSTGCTIPVPACVTSVLYYIKVGITFFSLHSPD
jgi:hypothetical protein